MRPLTSHEVPSGDRALHQIEVIWATLLRGLVLVEIALLLITAAVPLVALQDDPDSSQPDPPTLLRLFGAIGYYAGHRPEEFGSRTAHPYALTGGHHLSLIALVALPLVLVLALVAVLGLLGAHPGRLLRTVLPVTAGVLLVLDPLLLAVGQHWLSNTRTATPLQPGLLAPLLAGVWLLSAVRARSAWAGTQPG